MTIFEWFLVGLIASGFLFSLFFVGYFFNYIRLNKQYKSARRKRPPKNKRKRRFFLHVLKQLEKRKNKQLIGCLICFFLLGVSFGVSYFFYDYQQNHLQGEDAQVLVQSYYLLQELQTQIENIQRGESPQKSLKNIQEIASLLASYGSRRPSQTLKEDGQQLLTRYYVLVREIGTNINGQTIETIQNQENGSSYLKDIAKAQESQSQIFKRFNVNEGALKQK